MLTVAGSIGLANFALSQSEIHLGEIQSKMLGLAEAFAWRADEWFDPRYNSLLPEYCWLIGTRCWQERDLMGRAL
jgi:hypothetical protein